MSLSKSTSLPIFSIPCRIQYKFQLKIVVELISKFSIQKDKKIIPLNSITIINVSSKIIFNGCMKINIVPLLTLWYLVVKIE